MPTTSTEKHHPCLDAEGRRNAVRLHLPVAPRSNYRLRYTPATPATSALSPEDALAYMRGILSTGKLPDMVGITGPGDPLATPDTTLLALEKVRENWPKLPLCLTTIGIGGEKAARELAAIGLSHVTVLVNAVSPEVAEKLYLWVRPGSRTVPLPAACAQLLDEQERAIVAFKREGLTVKINTTVFTGLNAGHITDIARHMAKLGADAMNILPCTADDVTVSGEGPLPCPPSVEVMAMVRDRAARHMRLLPSVEECGERPLGVTLPPALEAAGQEAMLPAPTAQRPNVAVVSSSGMDVDLHLGHAHQFLIYGREGVREEGCEEGREDSRKDGLIRLLGTRPAPEPGGGDSRWNATASTLNDCFALLTASAGQKPRQVLSGQGLKVIIADGNIEGTVEALYGEGKKSCKNKRPGA